MANTELYIWARYNVRVKLLTQTHTHTEITVSKKLLHRFLSSSSSPPLSSFQSDSDSSPSWSPGWVFCHHSNYLTCRRNQKAPTHVHHFSDMNQRLDQRLYWWYIDSIQTGWQRRASVWHKRHLDCEWCHVMTVWMEEKLCLQKYLNTRGRTQRIQ